MDTTTPVHPLLTEARGSSNEDMAATLRSLAKSITSLAEPKRTAYLEAAAERVEKARTSRPRVEQKVRYLHDGKAMPDSQNKLSSVCYFYGKTADGKKMSTEQFRAYLAEHGKGDLNEPGFTCKLPTGVVITTIAIDAPIPAAPAKPSKPVAKTTTNAAAKKSAPAKSTRKTAAKKSAPKKQTAKQRARTASGGKRDVTPIPKKATARKAS
jgi:hypothetical protein